MSLLKEALRQIKVRDLSESLEADESKTVIVDLQNEGNVGPLGNFSLQALVTGGTVAIAVEPSLDRTNWGASQTIVTQANGADTTLTAFTTPVAKYLRFTLTETASVASEATISFGVQ